MWDALSPCGMLWLTPRSDAAELAPGLPWDQSTSSPAPLNPAKAVGTGVMIFSSSRAAAGHRLPLQVLLG